MYKLQLIEANLIGFIRLSVVFNKTAYQCTLKCFKHSIFLLFKLLKFIYIAEAWGKFVYLDTRARSAGKLPADIDKVGLSDDSKVSM